MPPVSGSEPQTFTLNVSGIAGFLGGEEAVSAMESVHFYKYRKYLGIYNTPGSYMVAKHYGKLARSPLWDGLYPGVNDEPAKLLKMDGERGPKYIGAVSGTTMDDVGHIGYIFAQGCRQLEVSESSQVEVQRQANEMSVTIVDFQKPVEAPTDIPVEYPATFNSTPLRHIIAIATILFSIGASVVCGIFREWYAFALILLGIVCNGFACLEIGSATICLRHPRPSKHSPPGNGILEDREQLIVVRGEEEAVNYIVKGRFIVKYDKKEGGSKYHRLGISATALTFQFVAQLFLIPQSRLFGQILFLATLAVSWINNACLSSIDKEALQMMILMQNLPLIAGGVGGKIGKKYTLRTRTSAVAFAMLNALPLDHLKSKSLDAREVHIKNMLTSLLPKGTEDWRKWTETVSKETSKLIDKQVESWGEENIFMTARPDAVGLLKVLLEDADQALRLFLRLTIKATNRSNPISPDLPLSTGTSIRSEAVLDKV